MTIKRYKIVSVQEPSTYEKRRIWSANDCCDFLRTVWEHDMGVTESFYIVTLDRANNITGYSLISTGGTTATVVDIKIIAKYCIELLAEAVIIAHNHPSGQLKPSAADEEITQKIKKALDIFGVVLVDHIILTQESKLSFADEGLIF